MSTKRIQSNRNNFDATISHILKDANVRIPQLNEVIERVAAVGLIDNAVLLGDVILERPCPAGEGSIDSEQVLRASLLIPDGIGVTVWDSEEYSRLERFPKLFECNARDHFVPFAKLADAEKALLTIFAPPLVARMCMAMLPDVDSYTSTIEPGHDIG